MWWNGLAVVSFQFFPMLSGQWDEIMLSGMPLHIPVHQYTGYTGYHMIYRSICSDQDINSHLSNSQPYVSCSIQSMERNYIEWNAPSHSIASIYMLYSLYIIWSTDQFPVTQTSIAIYPAPKHMFPILSGQWKEITLSGMPLHIPAD